MAALKTLDESIKPLAMRNFSVVQKALRETKQAVAADLLGIAESTFSDFSTDHLERACQVLAAVGMRVVSVGEKTYPVRRVLAWKELARQALDHDEDDITVPGALGD